MANQAFSTSPYGKALFNTYGARRPTLAIMGDSYGGYLAAAIQYACAKYYAADIYFDHRTQANGGRLFSVGGTSSSHMYVTQLPQFQANPADVVFLWTGYNSTPGSLATAQSEAANITNTAAGCLAAGAKLVVIMGQAWRAAGTPSWIDAVNTLTQDYARNTPGVMFLDATSVLIDPTSTSTTAIPPLVAGNVLGGYSADGVHPSSHAIRVAIAPIVWPVLQRIARKRLPRASINCGTFDPASKPDIDLTGGVGLMLGTGGQLNSVNNTGVAGLDSARRWNIITGSAEITATPSLVTGADGFKRQRITFGGTLTASTYVIFQLQPTITNVNNSDATRLYDSEAVIELAGVTGLCDIVMSSGAVSSASGGGTGNTADRYPDASNDAPLFYYGLYPLTISGNNPTLRWTFYFAAGATLAGYADISRVSVKRVAP